MTALVTKHLPLVAGAPDGIKKLRALILELAVRGKLVPHDPSDEPIAVLLARTAAAKAALQPRGRAKAKKSPNELAGSHPYVIPSSWKWCCLADLVEVLNGRAYKKEELLEQGTPVLRVGNLFTSKHWYYSDLILDEDRYCVPGDLLYAWSASFGPFIWTGERSIYHYHIWKLAPHSDADLSRRYLHDYLQAQTAAIKAAGHGVSMTHMTKEKMEQLPVPLPPLAEQHRIVAKVDELMALCDRLESDQADAEAAHAQLVQALLDSLTQATDTADFRASWQRLSEHFHTLFTTEASIDALKQTVLQLAVMGKLVPQDFADESPSILLERIANEVAIETLSTGSKKSRTCAEVEPAERYVDTPSSWIWTRLGSQVLGSGAGWSPSCEARPRVNDEWGVLKVSAVSWGEFRPEENKALPVNLEARPEHEVQAGDFLVSRANTAELVARSVVVESPPPRLMLSDKIVRFRLTTHCNRRYVNLVNSSPFARSYYGVMAGGTSSSMKNVTREQILNLPLPLPPLVEQHRIVAKVDELMALCDQLKAQLSAARQQHAQLATVLVEQAVA